MKILKEMLEGKLWGFEIMGKVLYCESIGELSTQNTFLIEDKNSNLNEIVS